VRIGDHVSTIAAAHHAQTRGRPEDILDVGRHRGRLDPQARTRRWRQAELAGEEADGVGVVAHDLVERVLDELAVVWRRAIPDPGRVTSRRLRLRELTLILPAASPARVEGPWCAELRMSQPGHRISVLVRPDGSIRTGTYDAIPTPREWLRSFRDAPRYDWQVLSIPREPTPEERPFVEEVHVELAKLAPHLAPAFARAAGLLGSPTARHEIRDLASVTRGVLTGRSVAYLISGGFGLARLQRLDDTLTTLQELLDGPKWWDYYPSRARESVSDDERQWRQLWDEPSTEEVLKATKRYVQALADKTRSGLFADAARSWDRNVGARFFGRRLVRAASWVSR
jgi:hypothetical protein